MPLSSSSRLILFREAYHFIKSGETSGKAVVKVIISIYPFSLPFAGYIREGDGKYNDDVFGTYWSNRVTTKDYASYLDFGGASVWTHGAYFRKRGQSVRSRLLLFREAYHFIESGETYIPNKTGTGEMIQDFPFSLLYSGHVGSTSGTYYGIGTDSYFWITKPESQTNGFFLSFFSTGLYSQDKNSKKFGFPVRCVVNRTDTTQRDKFINSPYDFPYSGYYNFGGGVGNQGFGGYWLSRNSYTTAGQAYDFYLDANGYVGPQHNSSVGFGFAVRCVAE